MKNDPLVQYLLENSRSMTKEESESYAKALEKMSKPTGERLFDVDSITNKTRIK